MTDTITVDPNTFAIAVAKAIAEARRQGIEEAVKALPEFGSDEEVMYFRGPWQAGYDSAIELSRQAIRKPLDEQPVNLGDGLSTSQFVIVPVEPTPEMIERMANALSASENGRRAWNDETIGDECDLEAYRDACRRSIESIYKALIEVRWRLTCDNSPCMCDDIPPNAVATGRTIHLTPEEFAVLLACGQVIMLDWFTFDLSSGEPGKTAERLRGRFGLTGIDDNEMESPAAIVRALKARQS